MVRRTIIICLVFSLFAIGGCEKEPQAVNWRGDAHNVILIVVDTLAAYNLSFMGYDRATSPFMHELADRSVVFDRAYSPKSTTLPAFTSMFSGLHPIEHNVMRNGQTIPGDVNLLTGEFRDYGFLTVGIPATNIIASRYGMNRGFEKYADIQGLQDAVRINAAEVIRKLRGFLESDDYQPASEGGENPGQPLFLFIHFFDPHTPYQPQAANLSQFANPSYDGPVNGRFYDVFKDFNDHEMELSSEDIQHALDMYDADILTFDYQLRQFFNLLEEHGLVEDSVILLTADHGENIGEHHLIGHGRPYEIGLHVPMMIHFPGDLGAGTRVNGTVEIMDVLPTLMDLFDVPIPEGLNGVSLMPMIDDPSDAGGVGQGYSLAAGQMYGVRGRAYSVFDGRYRLIKNIFWSEESLLYDVLADPHEENDLADEIPAIVSHLEDIVTIMAAGEQPPEDIEMDPETQEMLRSLGYLH